MNIIDSYKLIDTMKEDYLRHFQEDPSNKASIKQLDKEYSKKSIRGKTDKISAEDF